MTERFTPDVYSLLGEEGCSTPDDFYDFDKLNSWKRKLGEEWLILTPVSSTSTKGCSHTLSINSRP